MTVEELEKQVEKLRTGPLLLVCRTPAGKEKAMSIRECMETGSRFLHVAADELDNLLEHMSGKSSQRKEHVSRPCSQITH